MCEKYKDKKIFICHDIYRKDNEEYSILAKDAEEAKKILVDFLNKTYESYPPYTLPYDNNDIYCMDIESIKEDMIKENNEIELL